MKKFEITADLVNEALNFAQNKAAEYIAGIDPGAVVTVDEGEVYVNWSIKDRNEVYDEWDEWEGNAQCVFDERFVEKLEELQSDYKR